MLDQILQEGVRCDGLHDELGLSVKLAGWFQPTLRGLVSPEVDFRLKGKALSIQPRISELTDFLRNLAPSLSYTDSALARFLFVHVSDALSTGGED